MAANDGEMSRRELFRAAGAATATAAMAGAAVGCAAMPELGRGDGGHACDSHYCRYYRAAGGGRCALAVRERGGVP